MVAANDVQTQAQCGKSPNSKEASPTKATEQSPVDPKKEAADILATGKRNLLVADIPLAVSSLGEACELFNKAYGETAPECAESYFYYGKALLEMARLENGVLGNALDGVPEEADKADSSQVEDPEKITDEEKEDIEEKVEEALEENYEQHDKIAKIHNNEEENEDGEDTSEEGDETEEAENAEKPGEADKVEEKTKDAEASDSPMETDKEKEDVGGAEKEGEDKEEQEAEDEEDPSNLQLAWEMLELAKVVYTKAAEASKEADVEKKLCETFMVLGEVSLENENYAQAVEDLSLCLKRRTDSLPADSRCIAETHYQLGIAQGFDMKYEEAVVSLEAAIKVLEARIVNLKAEKESPDDSKKDDSEHTREKEISELEALIPEIKEKITDTNEMKAENIRKMKEAVGFTNGSESSTSATFVKPVASIAIKRKAEDKEGDSKKLKEDAPVIAENGDKVVENGDKVAENGKVAEDGETAKA